MKNIKITYNPNQSYNSSNFYLKWSGAFTFKLTNLTNKINHEYQIVVIELEKWIRLSAMADTCRDLNLTVFAPLDQLSQVKIALNWFHSGVYFPKLCIKSIYRLC